VAGEGIVRTIRWAMTPPGMREAAAQRREDARSA
jgi:hypothetical protein